MQIRSEVFAKFHTNKQRRLYLEPVHVLLGGGCLTTKPQKKTSNYIVGYVHCTSVRSLTDGTIVMLDIRIVSVYL